MDLDIDALAKISAPILSLASGLLLRKYGQAKSRVISFISHSASFTIPADTPVRINTHSLVVRNAGTSAATNVRVLHGFMPDNITVYPPVEWTRVVNPAGGGEIVFPVLVPKEQITISYLYFPPVTWNQVTLSTRSNDGFSETINLIPQPRPSRVTVGIGVALIFVGASFLFYWLVRTGLNHV